MRIIRTIHPVGQGAFYTEKFICENGDQKLVVYDCGAKSNDYKYLTVELSSYFHKAQFIDLLFVSHFDDDHINGIIQLKKLGIKIKTVVVPLIDQNNRWFYICTGGALVMGAINNPKSFFGADNLIEVESVNENILNENDENSKEIDIEGIDDKIKSGNHMLLSGLKQHWYYIPYNFEEDKRRNELVTELKNNDYFVNAAKDMDCTVEDLLHNDKFIEGNSSIINSIYKGICTDGANRCSLVVYSGPTKKKDNPARFCYCENHNYWCRFGLIGCGCLYLGDTDLNQGRRPNKIIRQLELFLKHCISEIGTIQLPHHGAIKNFNKSLLSYNKNYKLFFASFGNGNTYGHPSYDVVEQIISSDNIFCGVNENRGSGLIEYIRLG